MGFCQRHAVPADRLGADLLDEPGRRRSHDHRHLRPGRHALRLQVRLGAAGRPVAAAPARPMARAAAQLDAAGAGRHPAVGRAAGLERSRPARRGHRRRGGARRLLLGDAGHRRRRLSHRDPARRGAGRGLGDDAARLPHRALDRRRHGAAAAEPAAVAGRAQPDRAADRGRHRHDASTPTSRKVERPAHRLDARPGSSRRWCGPSPSSSPIAAGSSSCCSRCSTSTAMRWAARMARPFFNADGLLRAGDLRRHQELRRRRDHPRRPRRRHRRGALRPVQGAADRRHPAGDHQPPVRRGRRMPATTSSC